MRRSSLAPALPVGVRTSVARFVRDRGATTVAATRDGWLVLWDHEDANGEAAIVAAELDADGDPVAPIVTIATGARSPSVVTLAADRFRLFYRTATSIESRVVATGTETVAPSKRRSVR